MYFMLIGIIYCVVIINYALLEKLDLTKDQTVF